MKKLLGTILMVIIIAAVGVLWFIVWQNGQQTPSQPAENGEEQPEPEPIEVDTSDWQTYTDPVYGFSLMHPPEWQVHEAPDDPITPKFNIYKPESDTSELPFTHHTPDATHVSVYPQGIPTEGLFGEQRPSELSFSVETEDPRDFLLDNDTPYATFANIPSTTAPQNWNAAGFIFGGMPIQDHTFACFSEGEQVPNAQCDPLMGDDMVHMGSVNERDRAIIENILESFTFTQTVGTSTASYKDLIRVDSPLPESTVSSPLSITGEARGNWYFEATFPIVLTDWDGRIIAEGYAEANPPAGGNWMTEEYVPFEAELTFTATTSVSNRGSLILQKANASGLPENADAFEYTVYFSESS